MFVNSEYCYKHDHFISTTVTSKLWWIFNNYDLCSDVDDFIVDNEGEPIGQAKKKRCLPGAEHDS